MDYQHFICLPCVLDEITEGPHVDCQGAVRWCECFCNLLKEAPDE